MLGTCFTVFPLFHFKLKADEIFRERKLSLCSFVEHFPFYYFPLLQTFFFLAYLSKSIHLGRFPINGPSRHYNKQRVTVLFIVHRFPWRGVSLLFRFLPTFVSFFILPPGYRRLSDCQQFFLHLILLKAR